MMDKQLIPTDVALLLGRLALAGVFIYAGLGKLMMFDAQVGYAASSGMPMPEVGVAIALVIELIGGLMLLAGFMTRLVALSFVVLVVLINVFFHMNFADPMQVIAALKNVAIVGGMLLLMAHGAGKYSLDAKVMRPKMDSM